MERPCACMLAGFSPMFDELVESAGHERRFIVVWRSLVEQPTVGLVTIHQTTPMTLDVRFQGNKRPTPIPRPALIAWEAVAEAAITEDVWERISGWMEAGALLHPQTALQ